ncbi:hypothetical protein SLEP1_g41165 [Rubroshorea leprosula]|uniref:DNA2/NAM7 helicase-like C-terminal domain-containing protein n=1 Tax=Rubroshorea leprosula TaxID=152421 RepID=A0AAV5L5U2_9ROSI|nr:hypothetical protein SLEP1_g41165 [Rubroshorea leprosula]
MKLRLLFYRDVEISTDDGFQGSEKEAIVISTVRGNSTNQRAEEKVGMAVEVGKKSKRKSSILTLQHFISTMTPLLDLDKILSSILFYFSDSIALVIAYSLHVVALQHFCYGGGQIGVLKAIVCVY